MFPDQKQIRLLDLLEQLRPHHQRTLWFHLPSLGFLVLTPQKPTPHDVCLCFSVALIYGVMTGLGSRDAH